MKNYYQTAETKQCTICIVVRSFFNKVMSYLFDKAIKRAYTRKGWHLHNLPFYAQIGQYKLCIYAMDMNWASMRIKIEKDNAIWRVIKKGVY